VVAVAVLGTVTLAGLAIMTLLTIRMLTEVRRLREQIARTRRDVEPAYGRLRTADTRPRADTR
jgi:hypothetical protein